MSSTRREFPLNDEMKKLGITGIYIKAKTLFVENTKTEPITCLYTDDLITTSNALKQALVKTCKFNEKFIDKFIRFFADVWLKQEEESAFEDDGTKERKYYVQKYTTGISRPNLS